MSDWLWRLLGLLCCTLAAAQWLTTIWAFIELRWKSVPELWGIDWLDVIVRVERDFGVVFSRQDFEAIPQEERDAVTAGALWALIEAKLRSAGRPAPADGWEKMVGLIVEALNVSPDRVRPESRLYADLGMVADIG